MTKTEELKLATLLRQNSIDQPPIFHINNFEKNNIKWNKFKIRNLVYMLYKKQITQQIQNLWIM